MTFSVLGIDIPTGQRVEITKLSRTQGLYIIGAPGTGKTGLIENLIIQDIEQGIGVCLLDPHGDLTHTVLSRLPDTEREEKVILLGIADETYPFGLNLFACDTPTSAKAVQYVVDQVMHIFDKLFDVDRSTPLITEYLRNCTHTLVANPGYTMADIPLLLLDEPCRRKLVANVTDPDVRLFWHTYDQMKPSEQREEAASTLRRVREFLQPLTRNIVGQSRSTIDFRSIIDERKILLVKLDARLPSVTSLIGSVIVAELLNAAYARPSGKRKQFNIYADEFQRFATEDFATLLTEARKFGIATTIAHQMRDQLDHQNRGATLNVANLVVFKISGKDAEELAGEFDSPELTGPGGTTSTEGDRGRAAQLFNAGLREEGWTGVSQLPSITLTYSSDGLPEVSNEVSMLVDSWRGALGVRVKTNDISFSKLLAEQAATVGNAKGLQFYEGLAMPAFTADPQSWMTLQFGKNSPNNSMNYAQNNTSDAAQQQGTQQQLEQADTNPDTSARIELYRAAEQKLVNDVAWLPIEQYAANFLLQPYVRGIVPNALSLIPPNDWARIYISAH